MDFAKTLEDSYSEPNSSASASELYEVYDFNYHEWSPFQGLVTYVLCKLFKQRDPACPHPIERDNRPIPSHLVSQINRLTNQFNVVIKVFTMDAEGKHIEHEYSQPTLHDSMFFIPLWYESTP
jgi:hypothetical protein